LSQPTQSVSPSGPLRELAALFLKLGTIAFGGPAAHISMLRREVVTDRKWLSDAEFLDLLGATNLIPGPNSTEMAIHVGLLRAGWRGLVVAGACFILPAMLIVLAFAWAYVKYGSTPEVTWLLYGVKPVIIAVVAQALTGLFRTAAKGWMLAAIGAAVFGLYFAGVNEILLLFGAGILVMLVENGRRIGSLSRAGLMAPVAGLNLPLSASSVASPAGYSALTLFLTFLKIGAVLYGSGYVLLAFLRNDFVVRLGWLTNDQLLDAVAVGDARTGVHHGDVYRLCTRRVSGSRAGHAGHLPAIVRVCSCPSTAGAEAAGIKLGQRPARRRKYRGAGSDGGGHGDPGTGRDRGRSHGGPGAGDGGVAVALSRELGVAGAGRRGDRRAVQGDRMRPAGASGGLRRSPFDWLRASG
jgi:chromate transport protein ChrA